MDRFSTLRALSRPAALPVNSGQRSSPTIVLIADAVSAPALQLGTLAAMRDSGLSLALVVAEADSSQALGDARRLLEDLRPQGAVLAAPAAAIDAFAALCREMACPYLVIAPDARDEPGKLVCSNDRQGASDATGYLVALGHRRIGFVAGPGHCRASRERELGYIDGLAEHGLDLGADLAAQGDLTIASGREAGRLLLEVSPRPTAILASSDEMAAGVLQAAHALGVKVPEQLSVIGFGDAPLAQACWPPLTTMRLPWAEMAFTAAIKLIDPIQAQTQPVEFFCELVARDSTGALAG